MNNHMGSKFMENEELMEMVLEEIKGQGALFYRQPDVIRAVWDTKRR